MKLFLHLLSSIYQLGCLAVNLLYRWKVLKPKKAPLRVICIGNITFGGAEKTPLVMNVLSYLVRNHFKPALVSRGYRGNLEKSGGILVKNDRLVWGWKDTGDEPFMVAQNIPQAGIFIGKDRLLSCQRAHQMGFNVAVLDDGFQHRRLYRDLDIVLHDPSEKVALREPFSSLKRAHVLLIKKGLPAQKIKKIKERLPQTAVFEYSVENKGFFRLGRKVKEPTSRLKGKRILAFCGIARPDRFTALLNQTGIHPASVLKFPDHHSYPLESLEKIAAKYRELNAEALITTEKDAVKIMHARPLKKIPVYYLKIALKLKKEFYRRVTSPLQKKDMVM